MRMLLVEAAQVVVRYDPGFRNEYLHRCHHKPKAVAKVAAARKLAVRLFWMLRTNTPYPEVVRIESSSRVPWPAKNRRRIDWALSHPTWRLGVRIEESWPWLGRIDGWWNGKAKATAKPSTNR